MPSRSFLIVGFEKDTIPLYLAEACVPLCGGQVDETLTAAEDDFCKTFGVPEELVDVVVANNVGMVLFLADEFAVHDFVTLVTHKPVEGFDDGLEVKTFLDGLYPVLALWTSVVVVCTLENEAQALWNESDVACLTPEQEVEGNLPETVVLTHVVHRISPPVEG